ncbi:MAG: SH3 domain-containing protein [Planctomycetes bacterium]|nr:SH3 domain-containing protein [Planctomycetota bacterium]
MRSFRFASLVGLLLLVAGSNVLAEDGAFPRLGTVTGDRVSVRPGPSKNHIAFTHFARGTRVVVEAQQGDWLEVRLPADRTCWIGADYVAAKGDDRAEVTGNRVRIRVTPATKQASIGFVTQGQLLRTTGRKDATGAWVECLAPPDSKVFVHRDFVALGRTLAAAEIEEVVRTPGTPPVRENPKEPSRTDIAEAAAPEPAPAGGETPKSGAVLVLDSARLRDLYERYRAEHAKPIREWNYSGLRRELESLRDGSEDVTESAQAETVLAQVMADVDVQRQFAEFEQRERAASERIAAGEEKEKNIARAAHRTPPETAAQEYLAAGWVVSLGKHSKVDGTHKLMKGNKVLYFLRSQQYNLDDYANCHIGIRGIVNELTDEFEAHLIDVTEIEVLSR